MFVTAALCIHLLQVPTARDFMPLAVGTRWTYRETGEQTLDYVYEAEQTKTVGGAAATPIVIRYQGNPLSTTYYVEDDESVGIVAEDDLSNIYSPPRPLFKVGSGVSQWNYTGSVPFEAGTAPITVTGSSRLAGKKTILGKEVDTLEVTLDMTMTPPKKKPISQHQVAIYGTGVGLIEMTMTATLNGQKHLQHLDLIKMDRRGKTQE